MKHLPLLCAFLLLASCSQQEQERQAAQLLDDIRLENVDAVRTALEKGVNANHRDENGRTPLFLAAEIGDLAMVRMLVAAKASLHIRDKELLSPLLLAAANGHAPVVQALLEAGAPPDVLAKNGRSFLHAVAEGGLTSTADNLLAFGKNANTPDRDGVTPLMLAAKGGHKDMFSLLLARGADPKAHDKAGRSVLSYAVEGKEVCLAHYLLQAGADPRERDSAGQNLLFLASKIDAPSMVELLLQAGADPHARDKEGRSALSFCQAEWNDGKVAALLLQAGLVPPASGTEAARAFIVAANAENAEAMQSLLNGGLNPNELLDGTPLLTHCSRKGAREAVQRLLLAGADPNCLTDMVIIKEDDDSASAQDETPLEGAISGFLGDKDHRPEYERIIRLLVDAGAQISWHTMASCVFGHSIPATKLLLELGGDPLVCDSHGRSLLFSANDKEMLLYLMEKGVDVNQADQDGYTPLHDAIGGGSPEAVATLIAAGADPNAQDKDGYTPLHYLTCRWEENSRITLLLLDAGADPNIADKDGVSALQMACDKERTETAKLMREHKKNPH